MKWMHSRKGLIIGDIVKTDDTWTWIKLSGEHEPHMSARSNQGTVWPDGETVQVRTSLLTPLADLLEADCSGSYTDLGDNE